MGSIRCFQVVVFGEGGHVYVFRCSEEHFDRFMLHLFENPAPFDKKVIEAVIKMFCFEKAKSDDAATPPGSC